MSSQVVIVGGGFGGLAAVQALRRADLKITLIDRRNHHLFQPLLYQVATGGLSPANIAKPLRSVLRKQKNVQVILAEVVSINPLAKELFLADGKLLYDWLVVATGARHCYFGNDTFARCAPGLKSIEDATSIRQRILEAFETAERGGDTTARKGWLTFVIVGGGPTGVELAGAVAELGRLRFGGYLAWLAWLFVHLLLLVGFENRLLVMMQWWWNYWTRNRSARLITHSDAVLVKDTNSSTYKGTSDG